MNLSRKQSLSYTKDALFEVYKVSFEGTPLGTLELDVDGFYYFWPEASKTGQGYWADYILLELCAALRQLNAKWELFIETDPVIGEPLVSFN